GGGPGGRIHQQEAPHLRSWGRHWLDTVSAAFLGAWLREADPTGLLPDRDEDLDAVLDVYLLEKALYELAYELDNRPDWVSIPLRGLLDVLGPEPAS
ncbi:MAG: hypothetical protein R3263_07435, partial [Myxococcota bacterium]|nr:hypothetical protein [Myxococcota bacterium]